MIEINDATVVIRGNTGYQPSVPSNSLEEFTYVVSYKVTLIYIYLYVENNILFLSFINTLLRLTIKKIIFLYSLIDKGSVTAWLLIALFLIFNGQSFISYTYRYVFRLFYRSHGYKNFSVFL